MRCCGTTSGVGSRMPKRTAEGTVSEEDVGLEDETMNMEEMVERVAARAADRAAERAVTMAVEQVLDRIMPKILEKVDNALTANFMCCTLP